MLNKIFKTIHNKYYKIFKFIFFLRYLFAIFLISSVIFLSIPFLFDYNNKAGIIKGHLSKKYNFELKKFEEISFEAFPTPSLNIKDAEIYYKFSSANLKVENLKIYPKLFSIYNYNNFQTKKLLLKNNKTNLNYLNLNYFTKSILNQKNKMEIDNLNLKIIDDNKIVAKIENIKLNNFSYNKNSISGKIFNKEFKIETDSNLKLINFKLIKSGINATIDFENNYNSNINKGLFKAKILNSNFKSKFNYDGKTLNIFDSYFRNKNLSFQKNSSINFHPFFNINSKYKIEEINEKILKKINFDKILESKNFIKKINSNNEFNYKSKNFSNNLIDDLSLKIDLAYGRLNYLKNISISENFFNCYGDINLLAEFPVLSFDCSFVINGKKKLLKKFSIKQKKNNIDIYKIKFDGNLNILNKKISFKEILINDKKKVLNNDLQYYNQSFENILLDKIFLEIFNRKKVREFLLEIS